MSAAEEAEALDSFADDNKAVAFAESASIAEAKADSGPDEDFDTNLREAYDAINDKGGKRPDGPAGKLYDTIKEANNAREENLGKLIKRLGLDTKVTDEGINGPSDEAVLGRVQKIFDRMRGKKPNGTVKDVRGAVKNQGENAKTSEDATKWSRTMDILDRLPGAMKFGALIAGGILSAELIKALDEANTGCYVSNAKKGLAGQKLDCKSSKKLSGVCVCPSGDDVTTPEAINKLCPGSVDSSWTCDDGYDYNYKRYTWFHDLVNIVEAGLHAAEDVGDDTLKAFDFIKKYWKIFLIVIVGLLLIPLVMKIIELVKGFEGGTSPPAPMIIPV